MTTVRPVSFQGKSTYLKIERYDFIEKRFKGFNSYMFNILSLYLLIVRYIHAKTMLSNLKYLENYLLFLKNKKKLRF